MYSLSNLAVARSDFSGDRTEVIAEKRDCSRPAEP